MERQDFIDQAVLKMLDNIDVSTTPPRTVGDMISKAVDALLEARHSQNGRLWNAIVALQRNLSSTADFRTKHSEPPENPGYRKAYREIADKLGKLLDVIPPSQA